MKMRAISIVEIMTLLYILFYYYYEEE